MRLSHILLIIALLEFGGIHLAEARIFQLVSPEQMEPEATLICNGQVLSVEDTRAEKEVITSPSNGDRVMRARIKVLHVFKGTAPAEIDFFYRALNPSLPMLNPPMRVALKKDERYRFFLKPGTQPGSFVGVLDGQMDDVFQVEMLCPGEPDDHPYLSKSEMIKIAREFIEAKNPKAKLDWSKVQCFYRPGWARKGASCHVTVGGTPADAQSYNIVIQGDGKVDVTKSSWPGKDIKKPA